MRLSLISLLAYAYLVSFAVVSYFFPIPGACKYLIAQLGLLIFPYLVGKPLLFLVKKFLSLKEEHDFIISFVITWSFGTIFMVVLEVFLYVNFLFLIDSYIVILLFMGLFSLFIKEKASFGNIKRRDLLIAALYGFIFSLFVTIFWNYPYANANDYIVHTSNAVKIVEQNRPLIFYSDYLPTLHTLYAICIRLFNIGSSNALFLLWSSRFILYPIYTVGIFLLLYKLSNNRLLSLLSSIVGSSLINGIESSLFPWHTAPKNFVSILFVYLVYVSLSLYERRKHKNLNPLLSGIGAILSITFVLLYFTKPGGLIGYELGFLLVSLLLFIVASQKLITPRSRNFYFPLLILVTTLVFFHEVNGFLGGAFTLTFLFLLTNFERIGSATSRVVTAVSMIAASIIFLLYNFTLIPYPQNPVMAPPSVNPTYMFGWDKLLGYMSATYPIVLFPLFAAGCLFTIIERNKKFLAVSSLSSLLILAYFLPVYFSYRMLMYAHPFIIFLAFYAVFRLTKISMNPSLGGVCLGLRVTGINKRRFRGTSSFLLLILLSCIGLSVYIHNIHQFENSNVIKKQERFQLFQVGEFIKNSVPKDAIVIGYTWYQELSAFYGMVCPIDLWENGKYRDDIVKEIYLASSSQDAYHKLKELMDKKEYAILYPDPFKKEIERYYNKPSQVIILYDYVLAGWLENRESINKFFHPRYFTILSTTNNSEGQTFYVFGMNEEVDTTFHSVVENPSFENYGEGMTPIGWTFFENEFEISLDSEAFCEEYSLRVSTNTTKENTWSGIRSEPIDVEPGKEYLVVTHMKVSNVEKSHIKLRGYYLEDDEWKDVLYIPYGTSGTSDWKEYIEKVTIPEGVTKIRVMLMAGWVDDPNKGEAITWFDDIEVIIL